jgi:DNA-binding NarL/FixJ family response regulator
MTQLLESDDYVYQASPLTAVRRTARTGSLRVVDSETLMWRWSRTVAMFRHAVESYQAAMSLRAQMAQRPTPTARQLVTEARIAALTRTRPQPRGPSGSLPELTRRELEVARLIAQGYTNQQIAAALVISPGTAANHVAHVLTKLDAANRTQVAVLVQSRTGTLAGGGTAAAG